MSPVTLGVVVSPQFAEGELTGVSLDDVLREEAIARARLTRTVVEENLRDGITVESVVEPILHMMRGQRIFEARAARRTAA